MEYLKERGQLEVFSGLLGAQSLKFHADEQAKNIAAENAAIRKVQWGSEEKHDGSKDEMLDNSIVLGDIKINDDEKPLAQASPEKSLTQKGISTVAALALGAAFPGVGVAGALIANYFNSDPATPTEVLAPAIEQSEIKLGFKHFSDLK